MEGPSLRTFQSEGDLLEIYNCLKPIQVCPFSWVMNLLTLQYQESYEDNKLKKKRQNLSALKKYKTVDASWLLNQ